MGRGKARARAREGGKTRWAGDERDKMHAQQCGRYARTRAVDGRPHRETGGGSTTPTRRVLLGVSPPLVAPESREGDLRWPRSRTNHVADLAGPLHCEIGSAVRGPPRDVQRSHCAVWCGSQPEALSSEARVWRVCDGHSAMGGWRTKTRQESADRARCTCVGHQTAWWATVEAVSCLDSTSACGAWRRRGRDCRLGRGGQSNGRPCRL